MINLSLLQLFVKIAETGSIAAAARKLDIAPSIASRKIATLERAFKTKLLTRTTRKLSLTEAGQSLLEWSRDVTTGLEELSDELGALQQKPSGVVRIASNDYAAVTYLPEILARFCAKYPDVRIQMTTSNEPASLLDGTCDLALHAGRMPDVNLVARRLRQYRRRLCASPKYLARMGRPKAVDDLADHACLTHSSSERRYWSFEYRGDIVTQTIKPYMDVDNYLVLEQLALSHMGIARLSESVVGPAIAAGTLAEVLPDHKCVYADGSLPAMWVVFADRKVLHRTRLLADFLAAELK